MTQPTQIETEVWEPNPETPGYLRLVRMRSIQEVYEDLKKALRDANMWDDLDYFDVTLALRNSTSQNTNKQNTPFPKYRWLACFAVTGSNEGYYIHIEAMLDGVDQDSKHIAQLLYLGKTFSSMDRAQEIAAFCAKALGA